MSDIEKKREYSRGQEKVKGKNEHMFRREDARKGGMISEVEIMCRHRESQ